MRDRNRRPSHPGEVLREIVLPAANVSKTGLAIKLGISRSTLYDILDERSSITSDMAVRLGRAFGNGSELWLTMQSKRDLWDSERKPELYKVEKIAV